VVLSGAIVGIWISGLAIAYFAIFGGLYCIVFTDHIVIGGCLLLSGIGWAAWCFWRVIDLMTAPYDGC
jgi:hypothetical protein